MNSSEGQPLIEEELDVNNAVKAIKNFIHPNSSGLTGTLIRKFIGRRAVDKVMRVYHVLRKFQCEHPQEKTIKAYLYK